MNRKFALAYFTTAPMGPPEALLLAQRLGYHAIGIRVAPLSPGGDFSPLGENARLLRQTIARIKGTAVTIFDVEGVQLDEKFRPGSFDRLVELAGELGAKVVTVVGNDPDESRLVDSFASLCDSAAAHQFTLALEFMPYSRVPNFGAALRILHRLDSACVRMALDFLHATRSGMTCGDLATLPLKWLSHAQLCDAPSEAPNTREGLIHEARRGRLLPGDGGINLCGMLQELPDSLPLSIEIPNAEQVALLGPEEWARRALYATEQAILKT